MNERCGRSCNRLRVFKVVFIGLFLIGSVCITPFAQAINTSVNGTVKDLAGAVIRNAKVTLIDVATRRESVTTTNDQGFFVFPEVRAGNYTIIAEHQGFKKVEVRDVQVNIGVASTVNFELQTGEIAEVITTTATDSQSVVNTENAALGTTVQGRQIQDLPLNGRNPLALAGLQAGVNASGGNRSASVNGLRGTFTNLTWDGININDNFIRTDSFFGVAAPNVEGVSEFTLVTQNSGPGDGLGVAQVKLVTPRGANDFHGSIFEYHRNDAFDANTFFNNATIDPRTGESLPKEKLIRNQFGFNVGGPIKLPKKVFGPAGFDSKKLFFYTYYEGTIERTQSSLLRTVLTAPAREGNFTYVAQRNEGSIRAGQLVTVNLLNLSGRSVDPKIRSLIGLTPLPNEPSQGDTRNTQGFRFNSPSGSTGHLWGFRTDFDMSERHRFEAIFSRFTFDSPNDTFNDIGEPFPGLPGAGQASKRPRGSFAWNWTPAQSLNNEFRAGFNTYTVDFVTNEQFADGFRLNFPISNPATNARYLTNPVQNFLPQGRNVGDYEFIDNANWIRGSHQIRFGGNLRLVRVDPFNDSGLLPTYTLGFNTVLNQNPLSSGQFPGGIATTDFNNAGFLLGVLNGAVNNATQTFNVTSRESGFVKGVGERRDIDYYTLGFYGGDTWRIRPNLTLNLGLRWEYVAPPSEKNGLALLPRGGLESLIDPNAILDFAGGGTGRPFHNKDLNNFAPSISLAWDPFGNGKTSIRAGYAISYVLDNNVTTVQNAAISSNAGLSSTVTLNGLGGNVSGGGIIPIDTPEFKVPRTIADNLAITQTPTLFTIDPNLRTPYIQQWNLSFEREILPDTVAEVRYVGNRGIKLTRGIDINQTVVFENGFFQDFLRAQQNLALARAARVNNPAIPISGAFNPAVAGSQQLAIFPRIGAGGLLADATFVNLLDQGQVGELASQYVQSRRTYLTPGVNGGSLSPGFFLPANPNAFVVDYVGNGSFSNYHALQAEIRKRLRGGLYFQANYTFSKAFTDFEGTDANFSGFLDLRTGVAVEKTRIPNDITHVFKANWIYDLPFGPGKRFLGLGGAVGKIVGGWSFNGIMRWQSGEPISVVSARGALNRTGRSAKNTVNTTLSVDELQNLTGLFKDAQGRPLIFDPSLIDSTTGRANEQFFQNPTAGNIGFLQLTPASGPSRFDFDFGLIKRTFFTETANIEFRAEAFNILNHTNFNVGQTQNINSTTFGRITSTFDPRILQFALRFGF
jgi:Carboxypeptidase regulatory-like domain